MRRLTALFLFALAGCATQEQLTAQDRGRCLDYGFQSWTPEFSQCMMLLDQQRRSNAAAANAQLLGTGLILNQQSQPYTLQQPGFTCWNMGAMTNCR